MHSRLNRLIERMGLNLLEALKRPIRNSADEDAGVDGKKVYIMRPCMIHGPGNKGNLNLLYGVEVRLGRLAPSRTGVRLRVSAICRR